MRNKNIKIAEDNLRNIFRNESLPNHKGIFIDFLPTDKFIRELTSEFNVEFASVYTINVKYYFLFVGDLQSISIPLITEGNHEILIKHSHPQGTELPSLHDINWLKASQEIKSPQKKINNPSQYEKQV